MSARSRDSGVQPNSTRSAKGGRPRLSMETVVNRILVVLYEGCSWRAIHSPEAHWNSVYQYWRRWCRDGVWQQVHAAHAPLASGNTRFVDSTHVKVHRAGSNPAGGQAAQAMGITRGGLNTKIHAVVDLAGNPVTLQFTAGQVADVTQAPVLTAELTEGTVVADKAYDSDPLRCALFEQGVLPWIPPRSNRKEKSSYGKKTYRKRHRVENFFERIKRFRRVATRYDKLTLIFISFVYLASMLTFKK